MFEFVSCRPDVSFKFSIPTPSQIESVRALLQEVRGKRAVVNDAGGLCAVKIQIAEYLETQKKKLK